jgi:hypothetical protein
MLHRAVVASPATADEKSQVILVFGEKPDQTAIRLPQRVTCTNDFTVKIQDIVGLDNVVVKG